MNTPANTPAASEQPSGDAYQRFADRVGAAYSSALDKAGEAAKGTVSGLDSSPIAALLSGLAIGAVAGVLLPRIARERDLLDPLGTRIGDAARAAFDAAKANGGEALADAGIGRDQLREQAAKLIESAIKAAETAGMAAIEAARGAAKV